MLTLLTKMLMRLAMLSRNLIAEGLARSPLKCSLEGKEVRVAKARDKAKVTDPGSMETKSRTLDDASTTTMISPGGGTKTDKVAMTTIAMEVVEEALIVVKEDP